MGFLSGLFGKKAPTGPLQWGDVEGKPYLEVLETFRARASADRNASIPEMGVFQRRLYEIALWDNHVPEGHRASAFELAKALGADMELAAAGNPDLIKACRACVTGMVDAAPYGTLNWLALEHNIPGDQYAAFVIRREHGHLVRAFFNDITSSSEPETVKTFKRDMVQELIFDRRPAESRNAVLILHGLAVSRDATLEGFMDEGELDVFRNAHRDYAAPRALLVDLGVLPDQAGGLPFEPVPTPGVLADLIVMDMQALQKGEDDKGDLKTYLDGLNDQDRANFRFTRSILTLHLAMAHVGAIHGESFSNDLRSTLLDKLPAMRDAGIEMLWSTLELMERETYARVGFSPDFLFLDQVLHDGKEEGRNDETFEAERVSQTKGADFLSQHRTTFLEYFRYRLRYFAAADRGESNEERDPKEYWDDWVFPKN